MLFGAVILLSVAVLLGAGLAVQLMRGAAVRAPPLWLALSHGALGIAGFLLLMAPLRRGVGPPGMGTGAFATIIAWLLLLALVAGLVIFAMSWRRPRPHGLVVGIHASLAIGGFVILLALLTAGP